MLCLYLHSDVFIDAIRPDDRAKWHEAIKASARKLERFDHPKS